MEKYFNLKKCHFRPKIELYLLKLLKFIYIFIKMGLEWRKWHHVYADFLSFPMPWLKIGNALKIQPLPPYGIPLPFKFQQHQSVTLVTCCCCCYLSQTLVVVIVVIFFVVVVVIDPNPLTPAKGQNCEIVYHPSVS